MPKFVEFSREDSRSRREDPMFTLQARGVLSLNHAVFMALGEPEAVALLYDADEDVVALRKVERTHQNAYPVRKQQKSQSYLVGLRGFTAYHGIPTLTARRFAARRYDDGIWGFALQEGRAVQNRRGAEEPGPAATSLWRHTTNGFDVPALMRIGDVSMSHPGYMARSFQDRPPSMRIGVLVACEPLGATPATTELRSRFLGLLASPPVMELISGVSNIGQGVVWAPYGGHGRINLEASLTGPDEAEPPMASALLLLPEVGMSEYGRDPRYAELVVHIEPRRPDGQPEDAMPIPAWHDLFTRSLDLPGAFAEFLTKELELATTNDPAAQIGIWLKTPGPMTELVDTENLKSIPGSQVSNLYIGYSVADLAGQRAGLAAVELLRQMCDYTLYLDEYEPLLASLRFSQQG